MGFWSWLFPSDEEKISRARKLIQEEQFLAAREYLRGVKGDEAEKLRALAIAQKRVEPVEEPPMTAEEADRALNFGANVVEQLKGNTGDRDLKLALEVMQQLNQPPKHEPEVPFSEDPIEIATAVARQKRAGDPGPVFVDAVWLLKSRELPLPELATPERKSVAALVEAAVAGDIQRALASLDDVSTSYVDALLADSWPLEIARHALTTKNPALVGPRLVAALADPSLALKVIELERDAFRRQSLTLEALLGAIDAGRPMGALEARWEETTDEELFLEGRTRLLARKDLGAAELSWNQIMGINGDPVGFASEALFSRLAKHDPARALKLAVSEERSGTDELPRVLACHLGGADVRPLLDSYIDSLTADSYRPFTHFFELAGLCVRLEDEARLRKTLEKSGPLGWQIAMAARVPVMALALRDSQRLPAVLEVCSAKYELGFVAGRDASDGGLHAGNVVYRPDWLSEQPPRSVETLRITAALGQKGPRWFPARLA